MAEPFGPLRILPDEVDDNPLRVTPTGSAANYIAAVAALGRIARAAKEGYEGATPLMTPDQQRDLETTLGGRYLVSPVNQLLSGVSGLVRGGLAGGQAALYELGGRDLALAPEALTSVHVPRGPMNLVDAVRTLDEKGSVPLPGSRRAARADVVEGKTALERAIRQAEDDAETARNARILSGAVDRSPSPADPIVPVPTTEPAPLPPGEANPLTDSPNLAAAIAQTERRAAPIEVSSGPVKGQANIVRFTKDADAIQATLPDVPEGHTRLWRGNRPGEVGKNPQFTNSLEGIALPFREQYGGPISYVDVPTADLSKYVSTSGAAPDAEFLLPGELASQARPVQVAPRAARAAGPAAPIREIDKPPAPFEEFTVSTRTPEGPNAQPPGATDPHTVPDYRIGIHANKLTPGDSHPTNLETLRNTDTLPMARLRNPQSIEDAAINHMAENLVALHNKAVETHGQDVVDRSSFWYDGGHGIVLKAAEQFGVPPYVVAGVMANMSPQKDWYQNVSLGLRVLDIWKNQQNTSWTPEMQAWSERYIQGQRDAANNLKRKRNETDEAYAARQAKRHAAIDRAQENIDIAASGRTFREINDPKVQAVFLRAYDEGHNPRDYQVVNPEGDFVGTATTKTGAPAQVGWGSFTEIEKALRALTGADLQTISRTLGNKHKVRSFFNNLISPNSRFGHVTIDTHAIAAAHLMPLAGGSPIVQLGLGAGPGSKVSGAQGLYGLYHEAYQEATRRLNRLPQYRNRPLLPRQVQSIVWEALRGLFTPAQKRDKRVRDFVIDQWRQVRRGNISAAQARQNIYNHPLIKGIAPYSWMTGSTQADEAEDESGSTDE